MKKYTIFCALLCFVLIFSGCSTSENKKDINVDAPEKISTYDEAKVLENEDAVEISDNVNGMRYNLTLEEFSAKYNEMLKETGIMDTLNSKFWKKNGEVKQDTNGIDIQYYYYDAEKINLTATVEVKTKKIMNIGIGTTMSTFVSVEDDKNYSDIILTKCGIMAAAAGGFSIEEVNTLQDVFYKTTFDNVNELWYEGNIFNLSTSEDKGNSERSTMLFRVFPVSDEMKEKWQVTEYQSYIASFSE